MNEIRKSSISKRFNDVSWHDARVLSFSLHKGDSFYFVKIEVLFTLQDIPGGYEKVSKFLRFDRCRIFVADIDLLGLELCGGMIGSAECYTNVLEYERRKRNKVEGFDLPQNRLPLNLCSVFEFDLIHPSGYFTIFAGNFDITTV
ncbi:MAG: hypothetical protein KIT61_05420 [Pyrinomonadaceae bacterium]|nr:hypothetical protein [Pyrinomonadaceae bacterium]